MVRTELPRAKNGPSLSTDAVPHPRNVVTIPANWRQFGITAGQTFRFGTKNHDDVPIGLLPGRGEVILSVPPKGRYDPMREELWLARFDMHSGTLTRRKPVTSGALSGKSAYGNRVAWIEQQRVTDQPCVDSDFGCFRWALFTSDLTLRAPIMLARQSEPMPLRALPEFLNVTREGLCWTASDDGRRWSAFGWTPGGTPRRLITVPAWLRECTLVGHDALVLRWGNTAAGNGEGTILRTKPDGSTSTFAPHSEMVVVRGKSAATVVRMSSDPPANKVQVTSLDGSAPPRTVWDLGFVYDIGWLGDDVLWVNCISGLFVVKVSTGQTEKLGIPTPGARPVSGNGQLVFGEGIDGDTWKWRLVVLDVPEA